MRLQVNFRTEDSEIPDTEPFILEGLSRYQINQQLLNALVEQDDAERLFPPLPSGRGFTVWRFGEIFWETQCQEMQQLADRVIACRQPGQSMEIDRLQRCADNWLVAAGAAGWPVALASLFIKCGPGNATLAGTPCLLCQRW